MSTTTPPPPAFCLECGTAFRQSKKTASNFSALAFVKPHSFCSLVCARLSEAAVSADWVRRHAQAVR